MIATTTKRVAEPTAGPLDHAHNLEVERAILATVLDGRHGDAWGTVRDGGGTPASFFRREHRLVGLVIDALHRDGLAVDAGSVADLAQRSPYQAAVDALRELDGDGQARLKRGEESTYDDSVLAAIGGHNAVATLQAHFAPATGLARNVELLVAYQRQRKAIATLLDLAKQAQAPNGSTRLVEIADQAASALGEVAGTGRVAQTFGECADQVLVNHAQAKESGVGRVTGSWGAELAELDRRMPLKATRMTTLAGDTGGGKTSLALEAILGTARKLGRGSVAVTNLEQDGIELLTILIARELNVKKESLENGWLSSEQMARAEHIRREMHDLGVFVRDNSGSSTIRDITGWVHQRQRRSGGALHLIVLDHIGLVDETRSGDGEYKTVTAASKAMKRLTAKGLCVLNIAQMNREGRKGLRDRNSGEVTVMPEPRLTDLRSSGSLEQDSDNVLFLWLRGSDKAPQREVDLLGAKSRDGGKFLLPALFHAGDGQRFTLRRTTLEPIDSTPEAKAERRQEAAIRSEKVAAGVSDSEDLFQ